MRNWPAELEALATWLPGWPDAPWRMRGTTVTAWFDSPEPLAESLLGPLHDASPDRVARVRFYDVDFAEAQHPVSTARYGHFREAVVAFPARSGELIGEVSAFMWTDSETYLTWGREIFGWPLRSASFDLAGEAWRSGSGEGSGRATFEGGRMTIEFINSVPSRNVKPVPGAGTWITPRVIIPSALPIRSQIEINAVEPRIIIPGFRHQVKANLQLSFPVNHPLHKLAPTITYAELHSGFEIIVGETIHTLATY
jgi:hypothetical protein